MTFAALAILIKKKLNKTKPALILTDADKLTKVCKRMAGTVIMALAENVENQAQIPALPDPKLLSFWFQIESLK